MSIYLTAPTYYLSSQLSSIQATVTTVCSKAVELSKLFKKCVKTSVEKCLTSAEKCLIGDLRNTPPPTSEERESGFFKRSLGVLGHFVSWMPKDQQELAKFLNEIDEESDARTMYDSAPKLVGVDKFLLNDTASFSLFHRKEVARFLIPNRYASLISKLLQERNSETPVRVLAMQALAKGLLGIDIFPEEVDKLYEFSEVFKQYASIPIPSYLLNLSSEFRKNRNKYQPFIESILQREILKIQSNLSGHIEENSGLIQQELIKKIGQNPKCADHLHKDPKMKSLMLLLLAIDNLKHALYNLRYRIEDVCQSCINEVDAVIGSDNNQIDYTTLMSPEKMPVLDELYQECLNPKSSDLPILARYVRNSVSCGGHQIPSRTYLAVARPKENGSAFSAGRRSCPAKHVAEAMFKTIVYENIRLMFVAQKTILKRGEPSTSSLLGFSNPSPNEALSVQRSYKESLLRYREALKYFEKLFK